MVRELGSSGDSGFHREHEVDLDQDPDLEEKPRIPLKAAPAVTADLDENLDPYTTDRDTTKSKSNLSTKSAVLTRSTKKKKKIKAARTKLKAPVRDSGCLFEMELGAIQVATQDLYESLKILVGEHVQTPDLNYQTGSSHYASATSEPDS
ncbi:hypothetical protein PHMEG_00035418 [Phytophthora megakarya]|uniref:Uncharacterized protein n=1 Tax=Phytophthora megakarya TaxID=4795 RepID=A0A225UNS8_9STRA|nr:hypothetical protein PHMEG_00035418 [Phytophthora megakarya]